VLARERLFLLERANYELKLDCDLLTLYKAAFMESLLDSFFRRGLLEGPFFFLSNLDFLAAFLAA
jgi:hypothetical protein